MKWYCEKHQRDIHDIDGKFIENRTQFLYPYYAKQPKNILNKTVTSIEIKKPPTKYHEIYNDDGKPAWRLNKELWLNKKVRPKRNALLDEADLRYCNAESWSKMSTEEKTKWSEYKQALRDLTETIDFNNPVWPVKL